MLQNTVIFVSRRQYSPITLYFQRSRRNIILRPLRDVTMIFKTDSIVEPVHITYTRIQNELKKKKKNELIIIIKQ